MLSPCSSSQIETGIHEHARERVLFRLYKLKLLLRLIIADDVHIGIQIFKFIHILMQLRVVLMDELASLHFIDEFIELL